MSKKRIFLLMAAAVVFLSAVVYKLPVGIEKILPEPEDFLNNGKHSCIGVGTIATEEFPSVSCRTILSTKEGNGDYSEIHSLLEKVKLIPDYRNVMPLISSFGGFDFVGDSLTFIFDTDDNRYEVCILDNGTAHMYENSFDYVWSYRLENPEIFDELWNYVLENGEVFHESEWSDE